jgi:hypothetical protein
VAPYSVEHIAFFTTKSHLADMQDYEALVREELASWQQEMLQQPGLLNQAARRLQQRLNSYLPEKVHETVTSIIKQMIQVVLTGSHYTSQAPLQGATLEERETLVKKRIEIYRNTAAAEGGITGAGGFMLGLADFPLLLTIKLKLLFDIAALYGYSGAEFKERLYILSIFELAFSSDAHRAHVYSKIASWSANSDRLPKSPVEYDWRTLQQEYRDYVDLAKLAQLLPIVGAPIGFVVNNRLVRKLGVTAINAYRMRWFADPQPGRPAMIGRSDMGDGVTG